MRLGLLGQHTAGMVKRSRPLVWVALALVASCALNPQPEDPSAAEGSNQAAGAPGLADAGVTGGSGGSTGTAGSSMGGYPATGGAGAAPAGGADGSSAESAPIVPTADGWVDTEDNSAGIQGEWYSFGSAGTEDLSPAPDGAFVNRGDGTMCASGAAPQVIDGDFTTYYGAGIGFDLCATGPDGVPPETAYTLGDCPFNEDLATDFLGISFTLSGNTIPTQLRVVFVEAGREQSAYVLATEGYNLALIENASGGDDPFAPPVDPSAIEAIEFHVVTNAASSTPFEFCISDLEVILAAASSEPDAGAPDGGGGEAPMPDYQGTGGD